jgi:hypothetical protein
LNESDFVKETAASGDDSAASVLFELESDEADGFFLALTTCQLSVSFQSFSLESSSKWVQTRPNADKPAVVEVDDESSDEFDMD